MQGVEGKPGVSDVPPRPTHPSELRIGAPLLPDALTPELEREIKPQFGGIVPNVFRVLAPARWMVDLYLSAMKRSHSVLAPRELLDLATFVGVQEGACRYCYGGMRMCMRMLGYSEKELRAIENRVELDELSPLERAVIDYSAGLVRMASPPGAPQRAELQRLGLSAAQVAELAFCASQVVASGRITMLLAVQPDADLEKRVESFVYGRLLRPLIGRAMRADRRPLAAVCDGPFGAILRPLGETWGGQLLRGSVDGLLGTGPVPARTKLLLIMVLGEATGARALRDEAARLLADAGFPSERSEEVTRHLASPELDPVETKLVPLARDTIYTRPATIQPRIREATHGLEPRAILDVVGAMAVGNALARIATLA